MKSTCLCTLTSRSCLLPASAFRSTPYEEGFGWVAAPGASEPAADRPSTALLMVACEYRVLVRQPPVLGPPSHLQPGTTVPYCVASCIGAISAGQSRSVRR
jgi:hypothetical protein